MTVFAVAVVLWAVVQLLAFSWPTRGVRPAVVALAVLVGAYGCGIVAFGLETIAYRTMSGIGGVSDALVTERAGVAVAPVVEELVKLAPLALLLGLSARAREQWGFADVVVLGGALGAGFGLLEAVAAATTFDPAGAGPAVGSSTGADPVGPIGAHLGWTALSGLGVALLVRAYGAVRLCGVVPIALAVLHHAGVNLASVREGNPVAALAAIAARADAVLRAAEPVVWLLPLLCLAVAACMDARVIRAGKRTKPDLLLAAERAGASSARAFADVVRLRPRFSGPVAAGFLRMRRAAYYAAASEASGATGGTAGGTAGGTTHASVTAAAGASLAADTRHSGPAQLWRLARAVRADLDAADDAAAWRDLGPGAVGRASGVRAKLGLALALTPSGAAVVALLGSGIPALEGIRRALVSPTGAVLALLAVVAAAVLLGWRVVVLARVARDAAGYPLADPVAVVRLALLGSAGGAVAYGTIAATLGGDLLLPSEPVPGVHMHLAAVLPGAPPELLGWLALGFLPVALLCAAPHGSVTSDALGGPPAAMLRLAAAPGGATMRELRPSEQRTALLLAQQERFRGRTFRRPDSWDPTGASVDWLDDTGARYAAYGDWTAVQPGGDLRRFLDRLDMHVRRDVEYTVVDLTGFERWQAAIVHAHLENPPPGVREHVHKVVRVGF